jgi:hypothetical protein
VVERRPLVLAIAPPQQTIQAREKKTTLIKRYDARLRIAIVLEFERARALDLVLDLILAKRALLIPAHRGRLDRFMIRGQFHVLLVVRFVRHEGILFATLPRARKTDPKLALAVAKEGWVAEAGACRAASLAGECPAQEGVGYWGARGACLAVEAEAGRAVPAAEERLAQPVAGGCLAQPVVVVVCPAEPVAVVCPAEPVAEERLAEPVAGGCLAQPVVVVVCPAEPVVECPVVPVARLAVPVAGGCSVVPWAEAAARLAVVWAD